MALLSLSSSLINLLPKNISLGPWGSELTRGDCEVREGGTRTHLVPLGWTSPFQTTALHSRTFPFPHTKKYKLKLLNFLPLHPLLDSCSSGEFTHVNVIMKNTVVMSHIAFLGQPGGDNALKTKAKCTAAVSETVAV